MAWRALGQLEFMVSADIYLNETTRHADVILPGTSPFNDSHYDQLLGSMGYRNNARYSPPVLPLRDRPDEWRMMLGMAVAIREGRPGAPEELDAFEDEVVVAAIARHVSSDGVLRGRDPHEIFQAIGPARGMERLLDLGVRAGPWGDGFGSREASLSRTWQRARTGSIRDRCDRALLRLSLMKTARSTSGLRQSFRTSNDCVRRGRQTGCC